MADTVWIQAGGRGLRLPLHRLELTLAEWEGRWAKPGDQYAIHDGDCQLGKTSTAGCTCTPEIRVVGEREAIDVEKYDATIGRGLRLLANGLGLHWRLGLIRTETGWRLVLLNPDSPDPVSFVDGETLQGLFDDIAPSELGGNE